MDMVKSKDINSYMFLLLYSNVYLSKFLNIGLVIGLDVYGVSVITINFLTLCMVLSLLFYCETDF